MASFSFQKLKEAMDISTELERKKLLSSSMDISNKLIFYYDFKFIKQKFNLKPSQVYINVLI